MPSAIPELPFERQYIKPGDRVCAAVSGGADSVALLRALHVANQPGSNALGIGLSAAHVHHGLRGADADADLTYVQDLCASLRVPLRVHRVDTSRQAAVTGETVEEAARTLRYSFFSTLFTSGDADTVVTAHTQDDQIETVLMKLFRGAWTEGLGGIYPVVRVPVTALRFGSIVRPLLSTSRAEVESYLHAIGQGWREDLSNQDRAFTRNRLRHDLLPVLRAAYPGLDRTLGHMAEIARDEETYWQAELGRLLPQLLLPGKPVRGGGRAVSTSAAETALALEIERLRPMSFALRRRVLRAAARRLGVSLSFDQTEHLLALCGFLEVPTVSSRNGSVLQLSGHLRAERSLRELRLSRSSLDTS